MLGLSLDAIRISLHVLAAAVWVGGQITVAGLLPTVRTLGEDAPRRVAAAFGRVGWAAFAVLVVTGIWNVLEVDMGSVSTAYQVTLGVKLLVVAISGLGAAAHATTSNRLVLAVGGAAALLGGLVALVMGVQLSGR